MQVEAVIAGKLNQFSDFWHENHQLRKCPMKGKNNKEVEKQCHRNNNIIII